MSEHAVEERAHAILSASGASIWLNCPAAARAQENYPDTESDFSKEGTLAHAYCEAELRWFVERVDRSTYAGHVAAVKAQIEATIGADGKSVWNQAFYDHCMEYVNRRIRKIAVARGETPDALVLLEQRLDYSDYAPEGFGTGDLVIVTDKRLSVDDLKFGKGVGVEAEDNYQLKMYALGAVATFGAMYDFDEVVVEIDQPRKGGVSTSEPMSRESLLKWGEEFVKPRAQLAWGGLGPAVAGDHCRFCRARFTCRVRAEAGIQARGQNPLELTDKEITALLPDLGRISKWATDLSAYAEREAVAGRKEWAGWKVVEGRSNRKITDPDGLVDVLGINGFPDTVLYERSLLGLTELEKVVGKKLFTELSKPFIEKPKGALTLVPESHAGKAVKPNGDPDEDFAD